MAAANMDDMAEVFKKLRFQKTLFGGVSQKDVWKKLENLQKEYRLAYETQQNRYEGRLQERDEMIASLRERLGEHPGKPEAQVERGQEEVPGKPEAQPERQREAPVKGTAHE